MLKVTYAERERWAKDIRYRRQRLKLSQMELAVKAEVSITSVQKIEQGTAGGRSMYNHLVSVLDSN